ncbi:hypothetical protein [Bacillus sp. EB600]|uniref:hypothetical protein n=1 Tax=Bacillus sp. EB600 TaxID=2806345 RepID=UPI00210B4764|nr:hypothetical protein [Bacillus sp. EB600]MCQ6281989.1 hypothetical protein [Bacillus sp. EB600]
MNINIQIFYTSDLDSKTQQSASFPVNTYQFKRDPHKEAARVTFEWWKLIKKNMSYRVILEEVIYNGEHDITELVKQLDDTPIQDIDLPF